MGLKYGWMWLILMFISLKGWRSEGCLEQERSALLHLRHFLNDPHHLRNWVEGNSDCCKWDYVECSNTGRVRYLYPYSTRKPESGEWYLNASLFSPFEELEFLHLKENLIAGCVENEGFEKLSHLTNLNAIHLEGNMLKDSSIFSGSRLSNLVFLGLGGNMFNDSILSSLSGLSSLRQLFLDDNRLTGTADFQGLARMNYLHILDLSGNFFKNSNSSFLADLARLNNLEYLDLSRNIFNNSVLSYVAGLSSLRYLILDDIGLKGTVDFGELDSLINLEQLDMKGNEINQFVFPKGDTGLRKLNWLFLGNLSISEGSSFLQSLGSFPSLRRVELSFSNFSEAVSTYELHNLTNVIQFQFLGCSLHVNFLRSLGAFMSLEYLSLSDCKVNGSLNDQELPTFKNLKILVISNTVFNHNFIRMMGGMTSLESLSMHLIDLKDSLFGPDLYTVMDFTALNSFLQIIESLTSLKSLSIYKCNLTQIVLEEGICKLLHLQYLSIEDNNLGGTLPWCLANLTSLQELDVSSNHFTGNISSSPLKLLSSIQSLRLSDNNFQIPISLEPFFNHSNLKNFYGENNEIYTGIESHSLTPKFQLNFVILSGYGDGGSFPKFLYSQHELKRVDLSHINLSGEFPNWLLDNNTNLESLYLVNNSLSGIFKLPIHSHMFLTEIDISINSFHGHIPTKIGAYLPVIESLNMSRNVFSGSIPSSFGDMNSMESLDLSNNFLIGGIPEHLAMGCFSLQLLVLSNNSLQGQIFSTNFNLTKLAKLQLDGNNFTGKIPDSLSNCFLVGLYLSDNNLSGMIPRWLGNMSNLVDIMVSNNQLEGPIPLEFCGLEDLEVLDLSNNNINGSLPFCFHPPSIKQVHLSNNKLEGQLNDAFSISYSLMTLDLGYNHFGGNIPDWIGGLSNLTYLILSNNNFQGGIPIQLCQLEQLRLLDLSQNNFSGNIPNCLNITVIPTSFSPTTSKFSPANFAAPPDYPPMRKQETIEFTTKSVSYSYHGKVLTYMSGIDLSCNKLIGEIPHKMGDLIGIHTLNLSFNNLTGPIPLTFSNLKKIESMDLSYNNLNGTIPPQLVELTTLAVFSVAHNNLSGKIPDKAQFGTFQEGSYVENPLLCGLPLPKSCDTPNSPTSGPNALTEDEDEDFIDMNIFYISFIVSYIIMLLGIVLVLYINSYWRRTWFDLVETWMTSYYYFVVDHLHE